MGVCFVSVPRRVGRSHRDGLGCSTILSGGVGGEAPGGEAWPGQVMRLWPAHSGSRKAGERSSKEHHRICGGTESSVAHLSSRDFRVESFYYRGGTNKTNNLKIFATEHSLLSTFRHRSVDCVIERLQTKMPHTHGALRRNIGAPTIQLRLKMMEFSALNVLKQHVIQIWR